jgi:hypothetical protein
LGELHQPTRPTTPKHPQLKQLKSEAAAREAAAAAAAAAAEADAANAAAAASATGDADASATILSGEPAEGLERAAAAKAGVTRAHSVGEGGIAPAAKALPMLISDPEPSWITPDIHARWGGTAVTFARQRERGGGSRAKHLRRLPSHGWPPPRAAPTSLPPANPLGLAQTNTENVMPALPTRPPPGSCRASPPSRPAGSRHALRTRGGSGWGLNPSCRSRRAPGLRWALCVGWSGPCPQSAIASRVVPAGPLAALTLVPGVCALLYASAGCLGGCFLARLGFPCLLGFIRMRAGRPDRAPNAARPALVRTQTPPPPAVCDPPLPRVPAVSDSRGQPRADCQVSWATRAGVRVRGLQAGFLRPAWLPGGCHALSGFGGRKRSRHAAATRPETASRLRIHPLHPIWRGWILCVSRSPYPRALPLVAVGNAQVPHIKTPPPKPHLQPPRRAFSPGQLPPLFTQHPCSHDPPKDCGHPGPQRRAARGGGHPGGPGAHAGFHQRVHVQGGGVGTLY